MAVSMGNAIRELKYHISVVSIDLPEQDVSTSLFDEKISLTISSGQEPSLRTDRHIYQSSDNIGRQCYRGSCHAEDTKWRGHHDICKVGFEDSMNNPDV